MIEDIKKIIYSYIFQLKYVDVMKELKNEFDDFEYLWKDEIHHPQFHQHYLFNLGRLST